MAAELLRPADAALCRELLAQGSRSFSAASRLLPRRVRLPAAAVYAFCRVADDAIDEARPEQGGPLVALERLSGRLSRIYDDSRLDDPVDRAFGAVVRAFEIPQALPEALLEGFAWDAQGRPYADLPAVRAYGVRVASSVGLMMTCLMQPWEPRWPRAAVLARAADLGVAMQLTNIARDVGEDARMGRLYLPADWLAEEGVDPVAFLRAPRPGPGLFRTVARLLAEADRLYLQADAGVAMLPRDCRPAIAAARFIYADIGRVIARRGHDSVSGRAVTSGPRKAWLALRALLQPRPSPARELALAPPLPEAAALVAAFPGAP